MKTSKTSKEFVKQMSELKSESRGTSLITLLIPAGYSLGIITKKLNSELAEGMNIKAKNVREDVLSALKSSLQTIKNCNFDVAPKNGLVLCAGKTESYV